MLPQAPTLKPIIEGPDQAETLLFVQGWPDDHTLWDELVALLRDRYRCVRVDMPNYGAAEQRRWGYSHEQMVLGLATLVREVSPGRPVTLVAHDWGAYWGYGLHHHHPDLVKRIVGLDIAPHLRPGPRDMLFLATYQWWLIAAFVAGGPVGDWMTRGFARLAKTPRQGAALHSSMNYPYLYTWRDIVTGRVRQTFRDYWPTIPLLYVYGERKPGQFHSQRWLDHVRSRPGNAVVALPESNHWVTNDPKLKLIVRDWLDDTRPALAH
jgi:pimeloyl-ACP methyl ester carboxylesterase